MNRSARTPTTFSGMAALEQFVRSLANLFRALRDRGEIKHLAELDDRMLKDIGLTRGDVSSALSESLLRNPSRVLVRGAQRHSRGERPRHPALQARPVVPMVKTVKGCS